MTRSATVVLTRIVLPLAVVAVALAGQAQAARFPAPAASAQSAGQIAGRNLIAPLPGFGPGTPALAAAAVATCAAYATQAGWANNGYYGGDLVTAAAICVAESGGDPKLYACDENGTTVALADYPPVSCPKGTTSYDRGLWQLNSKAAAGVSDACAFNPICNAQNAYLASQRGTSFAPWSSYDQDTYAGPYLDRVQAAVTALRSGTVPSAVLGECLAWAKQAAGARVVLANCGGGSVSLQQWAIASGKLRAGSLCAAIASTSGNPGVVLARCGRARSQEWLPYGRAELRNAADGKCVTDPQSSLTAGVQVDVSRCTDAKAQTWWLP